jgi:hypothetical protein
MRIPDITPQNLDADEREELDAWRLRLAVPQWLRDNPGLVITGLYVGASVIGMAYVFQFFRRFRINVLEFTDPSDFLMVVVREPATIALALLGIPAYWLYMGVTLRLIIATRRRWPAIAGDRAKRAAKRERQRHLAPYLQMIFVIVYATLFMLLYSAYQARRVRAGDYPKVTFEYKRDASADTAPVTATLLGTTSRFLFVYRPETRRAEGIPFDAIARLSWDARPRREREAGQ